MSPRFQFWRRPAIGDFADAVRGELSDMPVPRVDDRLLDRIQTSRAEGARVILPTQDPRPPRRIAFALSAVVAAAIVVFLFARGARRSNAVEAPSDSWFIGGLAYAQTARADRPAFAPAWPTAIERVRPLSLHYARRVLKGSGAVSAAVDVRIDLARDSLDGVPVWRAATSRRVAGHLEVDTAWVSATDLRPLRRVAEQAPYRSFERIRVEQQIHGGGARVSGEMRAWKAGALAAHRTFDRQLAPAFAPYVSDALTPAYLTSVRLTRDWTGSLSVLGWAVRDDDVFVSVNLRVDGEDTVRVPAGEFACWRLAMQYGGHRAWYWVRKSDGVGVRLLDSTDVRTSGVRESLLLSR